MNGFIVAQQYTPSFSAIFACSMELSCKNFVMRENTFPEYNSKCGPVAKSVERVQITAKKRVAKYLNGK